MLKPIKWYKSLATAKGRLEAGAFLIEGERAIQQIITAQPQAILEILSAAEPPDTYNDYPIRILSDSQFDSICSTRTPQGIAAVVKISADIYSGSLPSDTGGKILLLEDIQDPGNVGTLIRSAAAFDFTGVILSDKCADPLSPKCVQSAAGTVLSLWLRRTANYLELAERLKQNGYTLVATSLDGEENPQALQQDKLLLALGNEASGLSDKLLEVSDYRLKIPVVRHKAESLNVAACGAICMYLSSCG
jgi:TrmH family RNA methyltransferase